MVSITFNGKNSWTDFGLLLEERPAIPLTLENVENIVIEGRSGSLTRRLGTYNNKLVTCKFTVLSKAIFTLKVDAIVNWLNYIDSNILTFSYDPDRTYKVKSVTISENIVEKLKFYGKFEVTFLCEPFKYNLLETTITKTISSFTIVNGGTVFSAPYLKIWATGDVTLTITSTVDSSKSTTTTITGVNEYVEIDSEYLLCYKGVTNMLDSMSGDFPIFQIGGNTVVLTGTVTEVDITLRTRYL